MTAARRITNAPTVPCALCPFRRDVPIYLRLERRVEIVEALTVDGREFCCHRSVNYDEDAWTDDGDYHADLGEELCAGALKMLDREGLSTQLGRITERLTGVAIADRNGAAVWTLAEFATRPIGAVDDGTLPEVDGIETCNTVDAGCLAPAGYATGCGAVPGFVAADGECPACGEAVCSNCADDDGRCGLCTEADDDG